MKLAWAVCVYGRLGRHSRLDWLRQRVQKVLNLARLFSQLVERAGIVGSAVTASAIAEGALVTKVVASRAANLGHGV